MADKAVYLSGGLRSGWQDEPAQVLHELGRPYVDPRDYGEMPLSILLRTELDIIASRCSCVLAYIEPGFCPLGLAVEVGAALAQGIPVVLYVHPKVERTSSIEWLAAATIECSSLFEAATVAADQ